ncbi:hypothetical protein NA57DRAFT_57031 [Rhizodiscina lignyota]|uniref:Uncharacterized protein n=1 Tax=Rhizodiscina lignyota TaxID=1504668 RepID=A0A9P4IEI2_9PEZI|nr:hypothetical protein NA57DRAFT_57031 [Rhizodiscina lignyota]
MLTASLQLTGLSPMDAPAHSSNDVRPGVDSSSAEAEETSRNRNLSLTNFTWENDILSPEWLYMSDLTTDLGGGYSLGSHVNASSISGELQSASNIITPSEQSFQASSSIPVSLAYRDPSSLFERRKFSEPELELTSDLALHILRSYPYMVANRGCVPPFIHPKYQYLSESDTTRLSPLDAALNLAKMLLHGRRTNKSLIWGLIRVEQERLLNEHPSFSKWEILEALQSLVVYILLRIIEGHHNYTAFGTQLMDSIKPIVLTKREVKTVCRHITTKFGDLISSEELTGQMILWKDWVFFESRRRIMDAPITAPSPAMPEYSCSPAPSPMTLWNAENEMDWAVDYAEYLHKNAVHGMLKNGDLVELKEAAGKQHDRWYAYADSFGLLVTLVANMII